MSDTETANDTPVTAAVTAPVPVPPLPEAFTRNSIAELAHEIAKEAANLPVILNRFGLSEAQFQSHVEGNPFFARVLEAAIIEWQAAGNTKKRIQLGSAIILEQSLPDIGARMRKETEPLSGVVEAAKLFSRIAGTDNEKAPGQAGEKVSITINLGASKSVKFEQETPRTITVEASAETGTSPNRAGAIPEDS
jgi:hypothetical protein